MKDVKKSKLNLFFSAFLIIGFVICTYFFASVASQLPVVGGRCITYLILLLFGLLLFYATRVGEGKQVKRFSLIVLLLVDLPALYIILATMISALPLHQILNEQTLVSVLAAFALGYGIPYTFLSGYELVAEEENEEPIDGGIAQELEAADKAEENSEDLDLSEDVAEDALEDVLKDESPADSDESIKEDLSEE